MKTRWRSLLARALIATLIAWVLGTLPLPAIPGYKWFAYVQVPVLVFLLICYIGKLLIDTFYQDGHYP